MREVLSKTQKEGLPFKGSSATMFNDPLELTLKRYAFFGIKPHFIMHAHFWENENLFTIERSFYQGLKRKPFLKGYSTTIFNSALGLTLK